MNEGYYDPLRIGSAGKLVWKNLVTEWMARGECLREVNWLLTTIKSCHVTVHSEINEFINRHVCILIFSLVVPCSSLWLACNFPCCKNAIELLLVGNVMVRGIFILWNEWMDCLFLEKKEQGQTSEGGFGYWSNFYSHSFNSLHK